MCRPFSWYWMHLVVGASRCPMGPHTWRSSITPSVAEFLRVALSTGAAEGDVAWPLGEVPAAVGASRYQDIVTRPVTVDQVYELKAEPLGIDAGVSPTQIVFVSDHTLLDELPSRKASVYEPLDRSILKRMGTVIPVKPVADTARLLSVIILAENVLQLVMSLGSARSALREKVCIFPVRAPCAVGLSHSQACLPKDPIQLFIRQFHCMLLSLQGSSSYAPRIPS